MLRVVVLGQRTWSLLLVRLLEKYGDKQLTAEYVPSSSLRGILGLASIAKLLDADIFLRVGYRPGAPSVRGFGFDCLWNAIRVVNPRAKAVYYWIGTDVLNALRDNRLRRLVGHFFRRALKDYHLSGAPWFVGELKEIGINATYVCFPGIGTGVPVAPPPLPTSFAVLSYIPDTRHEFYGGDCIYHAAACLPNVKFHVVGGAGTWIPSPLPNLHFHGWQGNMYSWYARTSVVVRMVAHDAIGGTIREGLAFARHAIYSYPLPFVCRVAFGDRDGLVSALERYISEHQAGRLGLNMDGREYALREFDEARTTKRLVDALINIAGDSM